ncbi:MAG: hypothetical protein JW836_12060 [Deltaproteobacteria bacterium]|nr:hypothetical protein [Deltaproteobacteria bacterium]
MLSIRIKEEMGASGFPNDPSLLASLRSVEISWLEIPCIEGMINEVLLIFFTQACLEAMGKRNLLHGSYANRAAEMESRHC